MEITLARPGSRPDNSSGPAAEPAETVQEIRRAAAAVEEARDHLVRTVAAAREAGLSYAAIGAALGISRQAAWERFAKPVDRDDESRPAS